VQNGGHLEAVAGGACGHGVKSLKVMLK